jgi:hypothetical protein
MQAYRVETTVADDGQLRPTQLPFRAGEEVEVIILPRERASHHPREAVAVRRPPGQVLALGPTGRADRQVVLKEFLEDSS